MKRKETGTKTKVPTAEAILLALHRLPCPISDSDNRETTSPLRVRSLNKKAASDTKPE